MVYGTDGELMAARVWQWQTLNITFNDTVDQVETDNASVQASCSGKTATFTFASTVSNSLTIGVHLNHGTSIDDLKMTGFTYSVN